MKTKNKNLLAGLLSVSITLYDTYCKHYPWICL